MKIVRAIQARPKLPECGKSLCLNLLNSWPEQHNPGAGAGVDGRRGTKRRAAIESGEAKRSSAAGNAGSGRKRGALGHGMQGFEGAATQICEAA